MKNKNDLSITFKIDDNFDGINQQVAAAHKVVGSFGMSTAAAASAIGAIGPAAARAWQDAINDLAEAQRQNALAMMLAANALNNLDLSLESYFAPYWERKAQQRAQVVLFVAFVVMTIFVLIM